MKKLLLIGSLFLHTVSFGASAPQWANIEKRLYELDRQRAAADAIRKIEKEMLANWLYLIRVNAPNQDEHRSRYREINISACEQEAIWRHEFSALEDSLKKTNNDGILPLWVKEDRNWQKLDAAMKRDGVMVTPSECRQLAEKYLK